MKVTFQKNPEYSYEKYRELVGQLVRANGLVLVTVTQMETSFDDNITVTIEPITPDCSHDFSTYEKPVIPEWQKNLSAFRSDYPSELQPDKPEGSEL